VRVPTADCPLRVPTAHYPLMSPKRAMPLNPYPPKARAIF
jgi:hypothetical protein